VQTERISDHAAMINVAVAYSGRIEQTKLMITLLNIRISEAKHQCTCIAGNRVFAQPR
jgi:hypothetical protein